MNSNYPDNLSTKKGIWRRVVGIIFILLGFLALVTPFTPGSWLIFVGFGMLGVKVIFWEKIRKIFGKGR